METFVLVFLVGLVGAFGGGVIGLIVGAASTQAYYDRLMTIAEELHKGDS